MIAAIIVVTIAVIWLFIETNYMRVRLSSDSPPVVESHKEIPKPSLRQAICPQSYPISGGIPASRFQL